MSAEAGRRKAFDWEAAKRALARAASAVDAAHTPGGDGARDILRERARRLAQPLASPALAGQVPVLRFQVGAERYLLELKYLREVSRLRHITPVPGAPERILGVTNLRGELLSVFDLGKLLDVRSSGPRDAGRLLVLGRQRVELGLVADEVEGVALLDLARLAPAPETLSGWARRYLRGLAPDTWITLDAGALLDDRELGHTPADARDS